MRRGPWSRPPASWLVDPYLGAVNGMDLRRSYLPRYMELITILNSHEECLTPEDENPGLSRCGQTVPSNRRTGQGRNGYWR